MAEYIERQAAIDAVHDEFDECLVWDASGLETANVVENVLGTIPPADVRPVVRCKDCRYSRKPDRHSMAENAAVEGVLICFVGYDHVYPSISNDVFVDGEHFCGYGEVRDG